MCIYRYRYTDIHVYCLQLREGEGDSLIPQPPAPCLFANFVGEPLQTGRDVCVCVCVNI